MATPLPKQKNLRSDTAWVIHQILEEGRSSRDCLNKVQRRHEGKDNAWIQEMSLGVMRQLPTLQYWLRKLLDTPLKGKKKVVEHLILLGMYQLAFSRVSSHAAVSETVNAASYLGAMSLKGLVNAVLRNFQRQDLANQPINDPIVNSGLPKWLYKRLNQHYPSIANDIIASTNSPAPIWLRVNTQKVSRESFCLSLNEHQISYTLPKEQKAGVILTDRTDITSLPGFSQGWFSVQDGAAQLAAVYLQPEPNDRVLDCCAAPGGKTGHLFEVQPDMKLCLAIDSDNTRLLRVKENMQRLQHNPIIKQGDALQPEEWWDGELFDRILLDAPCSATGVIRRHPDIRWLRKASDIAALGALQANILDVMWLLLKPGGTLLYATCSMLPEENVNQITAFLTRHSDALRLPLNDGDTDSHPGRQILPGEQQMDGFYYARLIKSENKQR
ncbi:16S rRNA (cytosine(967)-C(5))-methyltransferase RsmB [Aestuariibacter sp. A3R04]|uniref:16S rRNA (cytosine(967)-C(5))-methyltransferase RsmB n=1 Tax=Aestuariibacter sp. A3R04 TaxID=2841571 RepID=UPI001C08A8DB|nr:16S rRNA (cytosine(967)-C(5))-methyltransferase RsmB [Aestuariibacter sp. A3R04]MBU3020193.1 16S rRNA (cytosine(967)-C(5))-methyltransferase RsmB [Aestuariibacter sp. A3R04]